ncbi:MAG: FAD binding domain-containing protein [Rhodospirillaceae bacterium]|nr:FAD binding domain-containing protein [Rhodospirillaceae bacterium]
MYEVAQAGLIAASYRDVPPFPVIAPASVEEAVAAMADAEAPVPYAGGTDLCGAVRAGKPIGTLVWLKRLDELGGVRTEGGALSIGALTTHAEGAASEATAAVPGLADAWSKLGKMRIRLSGTAGGNLMARHTRYEMSILLTALDGTAHFASAAGDAGLTPGEIWDRAEPPRSLLTRLSIPLAAGLRLDYDRSLRPLMTQALALWRDGAGRASGRAVVATEYLRPVALDLDLSGNDAKGIAAAAYDALPDDFADPASGNHWLRRAGAAVLARQLERMEAARA